VRILTLQLDKEIKDFRTGTPVIPNGHEPREKMTYSVDGTLERVKVEKSTASLRAAHSEGLQNLVA